MVGARQRPNWRKGQGLAVAGGLVMRMPDIKATEAHASGVPVEDCAKAPAKDHVRSFARIQPAVASVPADWDSNLCAFEDATIFHTTAWVRILTETYRWRPFYFRGPGCMLPLIEASSPITGTKGVCLPFTDMCGPLGDSEATRSLIHAAINFGNQRQWKYLEIRGGLERFPNAVPFNAFYTHEVSLDASTENLFASFTSPVRRAIRKAEREGVSVEFSADDRALLDFWHLHQRTRRKHGVPPQPFRFMQEIQKHILKKDMGCIAVARHESRAIAACVFLRFGNKVLYKFGAANESLQDLRGTNAVFWESVKHFARLGCKSLNMGRTDMDNPGLRRFKLGWNARETIVHYARFNFALNGFQEARQRRSHAFPTNLFRVLPLPVLRLMGTILYRHAA